MYDFWSLKCVARTVGWLVWGTIYDVRFLKFEVRRAYRRVFRSVMGERMTQILRVGADFLRKRWRKRTNSTIQHLNNSTIQQNMTTSALVTMVLSMGLITGFTIYFFAKMLSMPVKKTPQDEDMNYPRGGWGDLRLTILDLRLGAFGWAFVWVGLKPSHECVLSSLALN